MFIKVIKKKNLRLPAITAFSLLAVAVLLKWPQAAAAGVSRGLSVCTAILIPSLFPFLIVSCFLVKAGVCDYLGERLGKVTGRLFGLPGCTTTAIIISLLGGYPAGSMAVAALLRRGAVSERDAKRLMRFCVSAGPAFTVSAVGVGMMGHRAYGWLLWGAGALAAILIGIGGRKPTAPASVPCTPEGSSPAGIALVESVVAACRSLLTVCGFAILFTTVLSLFDAIGVNSIFSSLLRLILPAKDAAHPLSSLLPILLEVSCGCLEATATGGVYTPLLLGFAIGFGGLSVHFQIAAILRDYKVIDGSFFLARFLQGVLTAIITLVFFRVMPIATDAAALKAGTVQVFSGDAVSAVALLALCAMVLVLVDSGETKIKIRVAKPKNM